MVFHSSKHPPRPEWESMMHSTPSFVKSAKIRSEGKRVKTRESAEVRIVDSDVNCFKRLHFSELLIFFHRRHLYIFDMRRRRDI